MVQKELEPKNGLIGRLKKLFFSPTKEKQVIPSMNKDGNEKTKERLDKLVQDSLEVFKITDFNSSKSLIHVGWGSNFIESSIHTDLISILNPAG